MLNAVTILERARGLLRLSEVPLAFGALFEAEQRDLTIPPQLPETGDLVYELEQDGG
jgi:hypothetical protein